MWSNLETKEQTLKTIAAWNSNAELPGRNKVLIINFPAPADFRLASIEKSTAKGTYGQTMYSVRMYTEAEIEGEKILTKCWVTPALNPSAIKLSEATRLAFA